TTRGDALPRGRRCSDSRGSGGGLVLQGAREGNGVVVWLQQAPTAPRAVAAVSRARSSGGLLLQGAGEGNGVVVWLRARDSLVGGQWPLLQRGDTVSPRGATVGVRYVLSEVAHGLTLDSGAVELRQTGGVITVVVRGT